jgi:hypothetical protein
MKKLLIVRVALALSMTIAVSTQTVHAQEKAAAKVKKAAIFVFKRTPKIDEGKIKVLEDLITAQVSDIGFQVLAPEVIVQSLKTAGQGKPDPESLEAELAKQTSAMRLAQNMGANLILLVYIDTYGTKTIKYRGKPGSFIPVNTNITTHNLRTTYRILFAAEGQAVIGDRLLTSKKYRETKNLVIENEDLFNELLDDASQALAEKIIKAERSIDESMIPEVQAVTVEINTQLVMPGGGPIPLPTVVVGGKEQQLKANVSAAIILDGVLVGTAPDQLRVGKGLHQIKVERQGYKPIDKLINIFDGQKLNLNMEMTDEAYRKWREQLEFLEKLDKDRKLTEAEAELIKAKAEALKKFGVIVQIEGQPPVVIVPPRRKKNK